jgi:hypothetical protein
MIRASTSFPCALALQAEPADCEGERDGSGISSSGGWALCCAFSSRSFSASIGFQI